MNKAVSQLFFQAIELAPSERRGFLAGAQFPEAVRNLASRLVAAHECAGDFLERTVQQSFQQNSFRVGQRLGPYVLTKLLAEGGMGEVFQASYGGKSQQSVVIKVLKAQLIKREDRMTQFEQEGQLLDMLRHPEIVALNHVGQDEEGNTYLVMEYVEGQNLMDFAKDKRLDLKGKLSLFRALCRPLAFCHQRGVIHCDLKPDNIMVTQDGKIKLLDFGVARMLNADLQAQVHSLTLPYASPEQVRGDILTVASDVHALGVMLYQLLLGQLPFPGQGQRTRRKALLKGGASLDLAMLAQLDPRLARVILRCVDPQPQRRYLSVADLLSDLDALQLKESSHCRNHQNTRGMTLLDRLADQAPQQRSPLRRKRRKIAAQDLKVSQAVHCKANEDAKHQVRHPR